MEASFGVCVGSRDHARNSQQVVPAAGLGGRWGGARAWRAGSAATSSAVREWYLVVCYGAGAAVRFGLGWAGLAETIIH